MLKFTFVIIFSLLFASGNLQAQTGYGTDVTGVVAVPTGKNAEFYDVGFGAMVSFYYDIEQSVRLALSFGFIRMSVNNEGVNNSLDRIGSAGTIDIDGAMRSLPVTLSVRLITPGPKMRVYGLLEAGIYTYWSKATGTYYPGDGEVPIDNSEFRSEPGFSVGGGVLFPLSESMNFDANIRYTFIQDSEYLDLGNTTINTSQKLVFGLGLNWFFLL